MRRDSGIGHLYWPWPSLPESVLPTTSTGTVRHMATTTLPANSAALRVAAAFAGIYVIWGTTYLAIAVAIRTVPPFLSGALRFLLAGGLMYAWLRLRTPRPFAGLNLALTALCGVLLSGIGNGFVIWAQQGIPSGIAALIVT